MALGWSCWVFLLLLPSLACARKPGPVLVNRPFVTIWNIPTEHCAEKYNVTLNLEVFDVLANDQQSFTGQDITLFYSKELGLLPYYTSEGMPVNGGLPQNASLQAHLQQATRDIKVTLASPAYSGLAVIDWEKWRPLWVRNWASMDIYQQQSEELVWQQHPQWPPELVKEAAKQQFEQSARNFMEQTLQLGETLRSDSYWGFYGFPDCYNNDFDSLPYTGMCPAVEQQRNKELWWLWESSRALYPSIYLPSCLNGTNKALAYIRHRVAEAFAVQRGVLDGGIPVLPYSQIAFDGTVDFLSQVMGMWGWWVPLRLMGWCRGIFSSLGSVDVSSPRGAGGPDEHHRGERSSGCCRHNPLGQPQLQQLQGECGGWHCATAFREPPFPDQQDCNIIRRCRRCA